MQTVLRKTAPSLGLFEEYRESGPAPKPVVEKPAPSRTPLQAQMHDVSKGFSHVDGLLYREPAPLTPSGVCGPGGRCTYAYHTGAEGVAWIVRRLTLVADRRAVFGLDYETGPCRTAPVDPATGAFDLSQLAYSTDAERNGSDPHTSVVFLLALSTKQGHADVADVRECLSLGGEAFREALGRAACEGRMIAHNAAFEWKFTKALTRGDAFPEGADARVGFDTMIASRLLYAGLPDPGKPWVTPTLKGAPRFDAGADACTQRELKLTEGLEKKWQTFFLSLHPETGMTDDLIRYVAADTALLLDLALVLKGKLEAAGLYHLWRDFEGPFLPLVSRAMYEGVPLDMPLLLGFRDEAESEAGALQAQWESRHPEINAQSQPQILALFQSRHPKAIIMSTDEKSLSALHENFGDEDAKLLLELRAVTKVLGTYLTPWIFETRNPLTGRIHCNINQADTSTGRMSTNSPNLQNIPSKSRWNKIRGVFAAREGFRLVDRDLSQFEVRALADMAGETEMLNIYHRDAENTVKIAALLEQTPDAALPFQKEDWDAVRAGWPAFGPLLDEKNACDIHRITAEACFPKEWPTATEKERVRLRKRAKAVTFGIPYGAGPSAIAEQSGVTRDEAQTMIDGYYRRWRKIDRYLQKCREKASRQREVASATGRKRFFPRIPAEFTPEDRRKILGSYERRGTNAPIQGINADVIKRASILMAPHLRRLDAEFRLWVHDEVLVEAPAARAEEVGAVMAWAMKEAALLCNLNKVPVETSLQILDRWAH